MTEAFLSLGSNMGDRMDNLTKAVRMLMEDPKISNVLLFLRRIRSGIRNRILF